MKTPTLLPTHLRCIVLPRAVACLLALALFGSGCSSLRTAPFPSRAGEQLTVRPGDTIRVHTKTGAIRVLKVTALQPDAFVGDAETVRFDEIHRVEVERFDAGRTVLLTVGIVAAVAGALAAYDSKPIKIDGLGNR